MHRGIPLHDDKIDFPFIDIPEVAEFDIPSFHILQIKRPFQQVAGDEVFETGLPCRKRPSNPGGNASLLFDGAYLRAPKG